MIIEDRVLRKINKTKTCWLWTASITQDGYSRVRHNNKIVPAHRLIYEKIVGKIPTDKQLDHLCRQRNCVNPKHLEPVSLQENIRRGLTGKINNRTKEKTSCPQGHPYDKVNTYISPSNGGRLCKTCRRLSNLRRYYERKATQC